MSDLPILNSVELLDRLGGSPSVLARLIPALDQSIAIWRRELTAALAAQDADRLRRIAHQAKGALLTFSAPRAAAAAKAIEDLAKAGEMKDMPTMVARLLDEVAQVQKEVAKLLPPNTNE